MNKLRLNDPDLEYRNEYDLLKDVYYKGQPFTGNLYDERESIDYTNGTVDGVCITYYGDGSIEEQSYFDQGKFISSKTFYNNGSIKTESITTPFSHKTWNLKSDLIKHNNILYFNNGVVRGIDSKDKGDDWSHRSFTKGGELAYTVMKDIWVNGNIKRTVIYNDEVMWKNYFELLICEDPELNDLNGWTGDHQVWMWFWEIYKKDKKQYLEIVNALMTHPQVEINKSIANIIAIHKLNDFIDPVNPQNERCYKYINEFTEYHENRDPGRNGLEL